MQRTNAQKKIKVRETYPHTKMCAKSMRNGFDRCLNKRGRKPTWCNSRLSDGKLVRTRIKKISLPRLRTRSQRLEANHVSKKIAYVKRALMNTKLHRKPNCFMSLMPIQLPWCYFGLTEWILSICRKASRQAWNFTQLSWGLIESKQIENRLPITPKSITQW